MSADPPAPSADITGLLRAYQAGQQEALDQLVDILYDDLKRMARRQLRKSARGQTLDTVGLVHDAYARLLGDAAVDWQDRNHFYAVVARAMRFVVVDRARRRSAQKRGGGVVPTTLDPELVGGSDPAEAVLAVDQAIERLAAFNERLGRIVECRFFAGMNDEEIGSALGVSARTVQRDWVRARAWLRRALEV